MDVGQLITPLAMICMSLLSWKAIASLNSLSGDSVRASQQERRDFFHQIERLLEKRETPTHLQSELALTHAQERANQVHGDNLLNRESLKQPERNTKPKPQKKIFSSGERAINE